MISKGMAIPGSGAGFRPQGQDHNFAQDFRESYNISVPIIDDAAIDYFSKDYSGNGKTKWPNLKLLPPGWKTVVSEAVDIF